MSNRRLNHDVDKIWLDSIEEAIWPTLVSSAIDTFPTARYAAGQRIKGSVDFRNYTSSSGYPLIGWEVIGSEVPEFPSTVYSWDVAITGTVKIAHAGISAHNHASLTAARRMVVRDIHRAQVAIAGVDDDRYTHGAFGIAHSSLITGKESGRDYCVINATVTAPTFYRAPTTEGDIDALGVDIWLGVFQATIFLKVT
jgi:hypothetical protein